MKYKQPKIEEYALEIENEILASSVVIDDECEVQTMGQEVVEIDMSNFNHTWE